MLQIGLKRETGKFEMTYKKDIWTYNTGYPDLKIAKKNVRKFTSKFITHHHHKISMKARKYQQVIIHQRHHHD